MANSEICGHCGHYETPHLGGEYAKGWDPYYCGYHYGLEDCPGFKSTTKHLKICPGLEYCFGDCRTARKHCDWEGAVALGQKSILITFVPRTAHSFITVL